ncbi:PAS domain S-box protein [Brevibacillus migulae]|uniref:PAS domain S-box protein n=1 Tax=Brevibacillus migulae TaxID=1644114 RepID=UPI00106E782E|nr:PAS domain S-box protein [Brevibacillus migulae]
MRRDALLVHTLHACLPFEVMILDQTGAIQFLNRSAEEFLGCHMNDVIGTNIEEFFPGLLSDKKQLECPHRRIEVHPFSFDGQSFLLCTAKDTSEKRRLENELRSTEIEYQETINLQQGMTFKYKKVNGRFIHTLCNGELAYKLGRSPETVIGCELSDFLPPDVAVRKSAYYERAWNGESVTYEGTSGTGITYLATLKPVYRNGVVAEVIGSCVDITDRKRVEEELRLSEERYRLIAENVLDLIRTVNKEGIILYASPSHASVLGYDPEALVGRKCTSLLYSEDLIPATRLFREMLRTKQPTPCSEFRYQDVNGNIHIIEVRGIPVLGADQEVEKVIIFGRDISERRKTEELLRHSDKLSVLGELAAGIAHEIRNPLTALRGFIQLLQTENFEKKRYLDVMMAEIDRINFIASELLLLAKPQAHHFKRHDLYFLLHSVIKLLEPQTNMDNIRICLALNAPIPFIYCEEKQMKQVFINLIKNGIEAMPDGGDLFISISLPNSSHVRIQFIDQGCGIPEELIPRLGEPFYSTKEKGTGLGLMVSQKIIKEHHGELTIESQVGKGTVVSIVLPTVL